MNVAKSSVSPESEAADKSKNDVAAVCVDDVGAPKTLQDAGPEHMPKPDEHADSCISGTLQIYSHGPRRCILFVFFYSEKCTSQSFRRAALNAPSVGACSITSKLKVEKRARLHTTSLTTVRVIACLLR